MRVGAWVMGASSAPGAAAEPGAKKALTGVAVEVREPKGFGRCRMLPLADGSAASLHPFVTDHVEPGATIITDRWQGPPRTGKARLRPRPAQSAGSPCRRGGFRRATARRAPGCFAQPDPSAVSMVINRQHASRRARLDRLHCLHFR